MFYAIHSPRNFSNEFNVLAFSSKAKRDRFVGATVWAETITRSEAVKMLGANYFDPGTIDARGGNCYLRPASASDRFGDIEAARMDECAYWIAQNREMNHKGDILTPPWHERPVAL